MARALIHRVSAASVPPLFFRMAASPFLGASSHMSISSTVRQYSGSGPQTVFSFSFWKALVPKPFRGGEVEKKVKSKGWNPMTFYIFIFIMIGSMAVNMIGLKKEAEQFGRQSAVRIDLLRDVVERIRKGEHLDVEKALGTGDPEKEQGWEELIGEIEREEASKNKQKEEKLTSAAPEEVTSMKVNGDGSMPNPRPGRPTFF